MISLSGNTPIKWFDGQNKRMLPWRIPYGMNAAYINAGNSECRFYLYADGGAFLDIHTISGDETYIFPASCVTVSFETDAINPSTDGFAITMCKI